MDGSRALSESSILTSVADDGDVGLAYYVAKRTSAGHHHHQQQQQPRDTTQSRLQTSLGSYNTSPMSKNESIGHSAADSPDETGWRELIDEVRRSWEEAKQTGTLPTPALTSPPTQGATTKTLSTERRVSPPRSPPLQHSRPQPTIVHGGRRQQQQYQQPPQQHPQHQPPQQYYQEPQQHRADTQQSAPVSPQSVASLDRWDTGRKQDQDVEYEAMHGRVQRQTRQRGQSRGSVVVRRSASAQSAVVPVADSSGLKRRVLALQRTVTSLQDDKANLLSQKASLATENELYRKAVVSKDSRLQRLRAVKQKIGALATLDKRNAELSSKRQQAISSLDSDIKNLFQGMQRKNTWIAKIENSSKTEYTILPTDWHDTRINPRNKSTLSKYRKPRTAWAM